MRHCRLARFALQFWLVALIASAYRFAWRTDTKVFPYNIFPTPSVIDNGDNGGFIIEEIVPEQKVRAEVIECVNVWLGNGACNRENNKRECDWDGGDCCRLSCIANCEKKAKDPDQLPCQFECGTFNGYECVQEDQGCHVCSEHGVCLSQELCVVDINPRDKTAKDTGGYGTTLEEQVLKMLHSCRSINWSQGDGTTINQYCGEDPNFDVVHDEVVKSRHFDGCGLTRDQCTLLPCCDDAVRYGFYDAASCNDTLIENVMLYDQRIKTISRVTTTCFEHFSSCFIANYKYFGQCCQCYDGWTGVDCSVPVCWPNCVHGSCVYPNVCLCEEGWQGEICNLGLCDACKYGLCSGPELCECFYGYEGINCDVPISYPPCLNGIATEPNTCQCDEGWTGRICDEAVCPIDCGEFGHCVKPNICECDPAYYSSDLTTPCDLLNPLVLDPNCVSGDHFECLECEYEYFLDPLTNDCRLCSHVYDAMCFECDSEQCHECQWPYQIDPEKKQCYTNGVLEWTNIEHDVSEHEERFWLYVRRQYGINGTVSFEYDMWSQDQSLSRLEFRQERIWMDDQVYEYAIEIKVFPRVYFETDDTMTEFQLFLRHPEGGAELGYHKNVTVRYFDDEGVFDAEYTYPSLLGVRPRDQFSDSAYPQGAHETRIELTAGSTFTLSVYMHYQLDQPKDNGQDVCYLLQRDIQRTHLRSVSTTSHINANLHQADFTVLDIDLKFVHVYCSVPGYTMKYYLNTRFLEPPLISRIERWLPQQASHHELKTMNYFTLNTTFFATYETEAETEDLTLRLYTAEFSETMLYIDGVKVIDTGFVECHSVVWGDNLGYYNETESCCVKPASAVYTVTKGQAYHFEMLYTQWTTPRNGLCIRLTRESTSIALDTTDVEARSASELDESPFIVHPVLNADFLDLSQSYIEHLQGWNPNSRELIGPRQIQVCVTNRFQIIHRFFNYQLFDLSDFIVEARLTTELTDQVFESFYDPENDRHLVDINPCERITDDLGSIATTGTLSFTFEGREAMNSPFAIEMVPGPFNIAKSSYVEWSPSYGCVIQERCFARFDPRDDAYNLLRQPDLIRDVTEYNFVLKGPIASVTSETKSTVFHTLEQSPDDPFEYYLGLDFPHQGSFEVFARINQTELPAFPLEIEVYSRIPDAEASEAQELDEKAYQVCSIDMIFDVELKDFNFDILTSSFTTFVVQLIAHEGDTVFTSDDITKLAESYYKIQITAFERGFYDLTVDIADPETGLPTYGRLSNTPFAVYWDSHFAYYEHSTISGPALTTVHVGIVDTFQLQIRDRFANKYNAETHAYRLDRPVYECWLVGDSTDRYEVTFVEADEWNGLFTFEFEVTKLHAELDLNVQVYSFEPNTETYSLEHIPQSPYRSDLQSLNPANYCKDLDLVTAGFGYTSRSTIVEQPSQVVSGESFVVKVAPKNIFYKQFVQASIDPISDLLVLAFVLEDASGDLPPKSCVCSESAAADSCGQLSGAYQDCSYKHYQCEWAQNSLDEAQASLNACQPCSPCTTVYGSVTESDDSAFVYLVTTIPIIGTYRSQLSAFSQGGLIMMIYEQPDFSSLVHDHFVSSLKRTLFDSTFHPFFGTQVAQWSAILRGMFRHAFSCDTVIPNRRIQPGQEGTILTFTVASNLQVSIYLDHELYFKSVQDTTEAYLQSFTYKILDPLVLHEFEIRLSAPQKLNHEHEDAPFFELSHATFLTEQRTVLPSELFFLNGVDDTLRLSTVVVQASSDGQASTVSESDDWLSHMCPLTTQDGQAGKFVYVEHRVPFVLAPINIQVRDSQGNQRSLESDRSLIMRVSKGLEADGSDLEVESETQVTLQEAQDYLTSVDIREAFRTYKIEFSIREGDKSEVVLPQSCLVTLKNGPLYGPESTARVVQQARYFSYDDCVFSGELVYIEIDMRDIGGNVVPFTDAEMWYTSLFAEFEQGSSFSTDGCLQYGGPSDHLILCTIRPLTQGTQSLAITDTDGVPFVGFPIQIEVKPSIFGKIDKAKGMVSYDLSSIGASVTLNLVDAYEQPVPSISAFPCTYYKHQPLLYTVGLRLAGTFSKHETSQTITSSFDPQNGQLALSMSLTDPMAENTYFLDYSLYQGLLLEDGLDVKFYATDNFQSLNQDNKGPQSVVRLQETLITGVGDSANWHEWHQTMDRFSVKFSALVLPSPAASQETYFFSIASGLVQRTEQRLSGVELWIDDFLVISDGQTTGSLALSSHSWFHLKLLYRVTLNTSQTVPQFFLNWQSASQEVTTIKTDDFQVVAFDPEETLVATEVTFGEESVQLQ